MRRSRWTEDVTGGIAWGLVLFPYLLGAAFLALT
jgi:hypothetical protein